MVCLQSAIAPDVNAEPPLLGCTALEDKAFNSHPRCYTERPGDSVCDLPCQDVVLLVQLLIDSTCSR
jgi:hypothetical protein